MADLATVYQFFNNADAYAGFLHRVEVAIAEKAIAVRGEAVPDPVTGSWVARQNWANSVLASQESIGTQSKRMLPALAITANDAGLIDDQGYITATDSQIRATIDDDLVDIYAGYVPGVL